MGAMSSLTDREYGPEGAAGEGAALNQAPAAGKHSLVEAAMAGSAGGASTPGKHSLVEATMATPMQAGPAASETAGGIGTLGGMFGSQIVLANGANGGSANGGSTNGVQATGTESESDRIADLVNRGAATDPASTRLRGSVTTRRSRGSS
jgi:hypothetical protein